MTITIKYFASAADATQRREESITMNCSQTVGELLNQLEKKYPALKNLRPYLRVAVGQEYGADEILLRDGDEVAIIPPVCGG